MKSRPSTVWIQLVSATPSGFVGPKKSRSSRLVLDGVLEAVLRRDQLRRFRHGSVGDVVERHGPERLGRNAGRQMQLVRLLPLRKLPSASRAVTGYFDPASDGAHHHGRGRGVGILEEVGALVDVEVALLHPLGRRSRPRTLILTIFVIEVPLVGAWLHAQCQRSFFGAVLHSFVQSFFCCAVGERAVP